MPFKGALSDYVYQLVAGSEQAWVTAVLGTIDERGGSPVYKISAASVRENHPHDIAITQEAPNYSPEHSLSGEGTLIATRCVAHWLLARCSVPLHLLLAQSPQSGNWQPQSIAASAIHATAQQPRRLRCSPSRNDQRARLHPTNTSNDSGVVLRWRTSTRLNNAQTGNIPSDRTQYASTSSTFDGFSIDWLA